MNVDIRRATTIGHAVEAVVHVPGSKSIANRALVCAALAEGTSVLSNLPDGDDTIAMVACLRGLGHGVELDGDRAVFTGRGAIVETPATLHAGLAGTTSRFVTALAALGTTPITIDGHPPLRRRPFGPLHDALAQLGVHVDASEGWGSLPVTVQGPPTAGRVQVAGDVSSQYVTALMLIGPYLPGGLRLELTTPLVSRPYVEMTAAVMAAFGHDDVDITDDLVTVEPGEFVATTFVVEPDASSASYPLAIAAVNGGRVTVDGLGRESLQGDSRFADLLGAIGCDVKQEVGSTSIERDAGVPLRGLGEVTFDMADISDLVPTLAAVALFADVQIVIRGVGFIRGKESDRLGDLTRELRSIGGDVRETDDGLVVRPSRHQLHGGRMRTHHDHRLAMAFAVIGTAVAGIEIESPEVVSKSWPGFWQMLDDLR